jgi:hypothetical protein
MGETQEQGGTGDGGEGAFDANAFEKKQEAVKLAAAAEDLKSVVTSHDIEGVGETPISKLDIISSRWRQTAAQALKAENPEGYEEYRTLKYPDGPDSKPDFATRKKAYRFAVLRFLNISYTAVEPDQPTQVQVVGESWRQCAVQLLKVLDVDAYAEYRKRKYGKSKSPDLKTRRAAYAFACDRFLDVSYKLAGF